MPTDTIAKAATQAQDAIFKSWPDTEDRYLLLVYLPAGILVILFIVLMIFLLRRFTFANWTTDNPNPYAMETLGVPRGAFRAILTIGLLFAVIIFEAVNIKVGGQFEKQVDSLLTAFQMMIAFYFGSKVMHHITSTDRQKTEAIAGSITSSAPGPLPKEPFKDPEAAG